MLHKRRALSFITYLCDIWLGQKDYHSSYQQQYITFHTSGCNFIKFRERIIDGSIYQNLRVAASVQDHFKHWTRIIIICISWMEGTIVKYQIRYSIHEKYKTWDLTNPILYLRFCYQGHKMAKQCWNLKMNKKQSMLQIQITSR